MENFENEGKADKLEGLKEFAKGKVEVKVDNLERFLKKYELDKIHIDFMEKIALLIVGAFGVIAAVAWDQVLKSVVNRLFADAESDTQKLIYALIITVLTAFVSIIASRVFQKRKKKLARKDITENLRDLIS